MKLRSQLHLGFTFIVVIFLLAGGFTLYAFHKTQEIHKVEAPEDWDQALQILKCERGLMDWDHSLRRLVTPLAPSVFASRLGAMQNQRTGLLKCIGNLAEAKEHELHLRSATKHFGALEKASYRIVELARKQQFQQAQDNVEKRWEPNQILLYQDLLGLVLSYRKDTQKRFQSTARDT